MKRTAFVLALLASGAAEAGWQPVVSGTGANLRNVQFSSGASIAYAVGDMGTILKSTDGGASWVAQTSGTTQSLFAVDFPVDALVGYAVGNGGTILKTTNGGASWTPQVSGTSQGLQGVQFPVDPSTGYAVGNGGVVLKTTNGGASWSTLTSCTGNNLAGIDFPTGNNVGYLVGDGGDICKTVDGSTLIALTSGTSNGLRDVHFPTDATTGYAAVANGEVLKTVDAGASWFLQPLGISNIMTGVRFSSGSTEGYVVGFGGAMAKTTDAGANWFRQNTGTTEVLTAIDFGSSTLGLAVGTAGVILRTTDGGGATIALHPTQNGTSSQFTGSTGCPSGKWDCVNDQPGNAGIGHPVSHDGPATMIVDAAGITRETFGLNNGVVPATALVTAIEVRAKVGIGPGSGQSVGLSYQRLSIDGSPVDGSTVSVSSPCCSKLVSFFVSGLSWTPAQLDALEIGIRHVAGGEIQASQIYVVVTYQSAPLTVNYRAIGTAPDYTAGTVSATNGSPTILGAGTTWVTANRGRGDRILIDGIEYPVLSVDSEGLLTLATPFTGLTGLGKTYVLARQFDNLTSWEDCIDGPPGLVCPVSPVLTSSLVSDNRSEVGIVYHDDPLPGDLLISGSTTDPAHAITLTAEGSNRHRGRAGTGAVINNAAGGSHAIEIRDDFVTLEWLEIQGSAALGFDGVRVGSLGVPTFIRLQNLLVHNVTGDAVEMTDNFLVAVLFNNILYDATNGIRLSSSLTAGSDVRAVNNTVFSCSDKGIVDVGGAPSFTVTNNVAAGNTNRDFEVTALSTGSDHNLSTDATAPGVGSLVNVPLTSIGFVSTGPGTEDLHLLPASAAADAGRDMSSLFGIDVDGDSRSAPWDMGADELDAAPAPTLSSASSQSFAVGGAPQVASTITITEDPSSPTITGLDDIRIRIPLAFPMQWDPSVVTVTLGGSALGKVDTAVKAVEDSGRTVVLDVTADFLPGDSLTVADLKFFSFTALATPDHLGLEVGNDDVVIAVDDKTIDIFATGVPRLSSDANQGFVVGSPPVPAVPFTISNSSPSSITAAADLRVWIPAGFLMTWNPFDTSASISGPGASKVSPVVSFENGNRTLLLDVTTDFGSSDFVTVSGLSFASFTGVSAPDELELEVDGLGGIADVDDKRIFIDGFSDVAILTATATSLRVEIQWVFPDAGACDHVHVVRDTGGFPAPLGGTLVVNAPCAGFMGMPFSAIDAPPANDVEYFYSAYVYTGVGYTPGQFVKARPFDTSGAVKWAYSTGATSMAPPGLRFSGPDSFVYVVSNDSILHGLRGGDTGGTWPAGFEPFKLGRPAQNRPPVVSFTVGSANGAAFLGSEDGNVYAVDATDGSLEWVSPVANLVVAAPAGHFTAYDVGATDLVLVGTRNGSAANALKALDVATGAPVWSFVNSLVDGEGQDIGIISGGASVDYQNQRIYFTSRQRASGSQKTLWAIDFTPSLLWNANLGNIDGSPVLVNGRVYVGTVAGAVAVRDAASGTGGWTLPLGDGAIKGFVFPRFGTNELFVSTNGKVWAIADNTTSGSVVAGWPVTSIPSPSIPLYPPPSTHLLVGSSNGKLYQIDILSPSTPTSVVLGDGSAAVGAPTLDWPNSMIYVGTDAGIIYGVLYPLP